MFKGSITALVTPFKNGAVDEDAVAALAERQIRAGTHGLVPCGTTGENATLTFEEHMRVVEIVVQTARGRVPVIAGTGSNSTAVAIQNQARAKELGADIVLSGGPDLIDEVKDLTGGGAHVAIDFVGEHGTENTCWKLLRQGGELIMVGYGGEVVVPTLELVANEIRIGGSLVGDFVELVELMELNADGHVKMHQTEYKLANINEAISDFKDRKFTGRGVIVP